MVLVKKRSKLLYWKYGKTYSYSIMWIFLVLKILLTEKKYPIIPFLVIDHISKPFDASNAKAIGQVIEKSIYIHRKRKFANIYV